MHELRRLYWYNITAYLSFLLFLLLGLNEYTLEHRIFVIIVPIALQLLTLFIFFTKKTQDLKYIRYYTIPDFIVRLISLELCVLGSVYCRSRLGLTLVLDILLILFAINLTLEKIMSIRISRYQDAYVNEAKISECQGSALISIGVSYFETILLLFMLLLPFNLTSTLSISGYVIWGTLLTVSLLLYIRLTFNTLYRFYKKEKEVRYYFMIENAGVIVLLIWLSIYGYFFGFITFADGIFYLTSMLLLLPRQINREKRLLVYNEARKG